MVTRNVAQHIASAFTAAINCAKSESEEWYHRHMDHVDEMVKNYLPSGSGFDSGTRFDYDKSTPEKLVFETAFHHMDPNGFYDGWTDHTVTVRPSFDYGLDIRVSGRNRNDIKNYIAEVFRVALSQAIARG